MCFKVKTPKIDTNVPASTLVPQTEAKTPEAPEYGGANSALNKRKGRQQLTINRNGSYRPTNF